MPTIIHFDIGADNLERAKQFYENLFGWKISIIEEIPGYYEIETSDLEGIKSIGGGITKRESPQQTGITQFFGVASIDESMEKLTALGGKIVQPKQVIPGYGYIALCADTENNVFGLFRDDPNAKLEINADPHKEKVIAVQ